MTKIKKIKGKLYNYKVRIGKTFIEFKDYHGWTTRFNTKEGLEIIQECKETRRYVWVDQNMLEELLKFLKKIRRGV